MELHFLGKSKIYNKEFHFIYLTFSVTFTGVTAGSGTTSAQTINYQKISNGTDTIIILKIPIFTVSVGGANAPYGILLQTATMPSDITPTYSVFLPVCATFGGIVQTGWLQIWSGINGSFGLRPNTGGGAPANTVCGINQPCSVSYML